MKTIVTLLYDLGTRDASVAATKAMITAASPDTAIVDISHQVAPYDLQQAAYLLVSAYKHFLSGTIHVLLVDALSGDSPTMVLAEIGGYYFIAPDNGILPLAFGPAIEKLWLCHKLAKPYMFSEWLDKTGAVVKSVISGSYTSDFPETTLLNTPRAVEPKVMPGAVECNILYIDRYENVVLSITKNQFERIIGDKPFLIKLTRVQEVRTLSINYNDVPEGDPLCRFNDAGYLEIALNHDRAATLMGIENTANIRYKTIRMLL